MQQSIMGIVAQAKAVGIEFLGFVTQKSGATSYTVDVSGMGLSEGDVVVVAHGNSRYFNTGLSVTGYTSEFNLYVNDSYDTNFQVAWKVMTATPDTSISITTGSDSAYGSVAMVYAFRGVDTVTPMDVSSVSATGTNNGNPNPPSITPTTAGALILATGASGSISSAMTTPSGYENANVVRNDTSPYFLYIGMATKIRSSGAEDPGTFNANGSGTSSSWAAGTLALRPL